MQEFTDEGNLVIRRDPIAASLRQARRELRRLRRMNQRLWRRAGHLSFVAHQVSGPQARRAELIAADLECILADRLAPAADALERLASGDTLRADLEHPAEPDE